LYISGFSNAFASDTQAVPAGISNHGGNNVFFNRTKAEMISADKAIPGRDEPTFHVPNRHVVLDTPLKPPFPEGMEISILALGCFWGAERLFWEMDGVYTTAAGYA